MLPQGWLYQSRKLDMCLHLARSSFMSLHKVLQFSYMSQSSIFFKGTINFDFIGLQYLRTGRDWKTILSPYPVCCWAHLSNNQRYMGYFVFVSTWWHHTISIFCDFQFITRTTGLGKSSVSVNTHRLDPFWSLHGVLWRWYRIIWLIIPLSLDIQAISVILLLQISQLPTLNPK